MKSVFILGLLAMSIFFSIFAPAHDTRVPPWLKSGGIPEQIAGNCDKMQKDLAEVINRPDTTDAKKIKGALGLHVLNSCDKGGNGLVICYQCMDQDHHLRAIQLVQNPKSRKFKLFGFGCRCKE